MGKPLSDKTSGEIFRSDKTLYGRYMMRDGGEFPCRIGSVGYDSIHVIPLGDVYGDDMDVIVYCDVIGRVEGRIKNSTPTGFDVSVSPAQMRKIERLLSSFESGFGEDTIGNFDSDASSLVTSSGDYHPCRMLYSSEKDATIEADILTSLGARVILNDRAGTVSEIHAHGMKISFSDE